MRYGAKFGLLWGMCVANHMHYRRIVSCSTIIRHTIIVHIYCGFSTSAPACPVRFGIGTQALIASQADSSLPRCFSPQCNRANSTLECQSRIGCTMCIHNDSNGVTVMDCWLEGSCPMGSEPTVATVPSESSDSDELATWQALTAIFLALVVVIAAILAVIVMRYLLDRAQRRHGQLSVTTSEHTVSSVTVDKHSHPAVELSSISCSAKDTRSVQSKEPACSSPITQISSTNAMYQPESLNGPTTMYQGSPSAPYPAIPDTPVSPDGFSELLRNGQGSLNPSNAGGIWF